VNATNSTRAILDASNLTTTSDGSWQLYYQVRIIESSRWVTEPLTIDIRTINSEEQGNFLVGFGVFNMLTTVLSFLAVALYLGPKQEDFIQPSQEIECEY
jgi:hypothetical protein